MENANVTVQETQDSVIGPIRADLFQEDGRLKPRGLRRLVSALENNGIPPTVSTDPAVRESHRPKLVALLSRLSEGTVTKDREGLIEDLNRILGFRKPGRPVDPNKVKTEKATGQREAIRLAWDKMLVMVNPEPGQAVAYEIDATKATRGNVNLAKLAEAWVSAGLPATQLPSEPTALATFGVAIRKTFKGAENIGNGEYRIFADDGEGVTDHGNYDRKGELYTVACSFEGTVTFRSGKLTAEDAKVHAAKLLAEMAAESSAQRTALKIALKRWFNDTVLANLGQRWDSESQKYLILASSYPAYRKIVGLWVSAGGVAPHEHALMSATDFTVETAQALADEIADRLTEWNGMLADTDLSPTRAHNAVVEIERFKKRAENMVQLLGGADTFASLFTQMSNLAAKLGSVRTRGNVLEVD